MSELNIGDKFGNLTLVSWVRGEGGVRGYWVCYCDCGGYMEAKTADLKKGKTIRCKACKSEAIRKRSSKKYNRDTNPKIYDKWSGMINRVRNHPHYIKNGIAVCSSWDVKQGGSFENFYKDMKTDYVEGYSLDRIDNDKGYFKNNCRWVPLECQTGNRKPFKDYEYKGIRCNTKGEYLVKINHKNHIYRLGKSSSLGRAKRMYDEVARCLREDITYKHGAEDSLRSEECSLKFHEITCFEFYTGKVYLEGKSLIAMKNGEGYWFPSRASVRKKGFDLRAVCRCIKGEVDTHKGYTFSDI